MSWQVYLTDGFGPKRMVYMPTEAFAGELQGNKELAAAFNACVIPSVACTDLEVAWVGLTEDKKRLLRAATHSDGCRFPA